MFNWDELTFDQMLYCNAVDYAYANGDTAQLAKLEAEDTELYAYAISLIELTEENEE